MPSCPACEKFLEIEQRGMQFFCMNCGQEFQAEAKTFIELLPEEEESPK